ncbi:hypothetical protein [Flavobacterium anhuiense]|uniref:hypothetical protein n=1 Tax=Flavobacterium anhuiense TaxID=459526 RepID=UPI002025E9D6|nr:hypothetical protein [Flavobacterium anhuiense]URM35532.1 hypothetical protein LLY39_13870 [Flavobacterium anhuiense]
MRSQSTVLGSNSATGLTLYEYYNHGASEWLKLFKIKNSDWNYGGVAGSLYFIDYQGKGASRIDFVFPQSINANQKPQLKLVGNSSIDILWYTLGSPNNDYYEVYIKTPSYHVGLTFLFRASFADSYIIPQIPAGQNWNWSSSLNPESIQTELGDGNVGIGVTLPKNKLDVNGTIHSKEVKVDMTGWSDFVFKKEYNLPTLEEVEKHIAEKGHLENIPSEEEVLKNGINLGEMNSKLLQKIEELTLYLIEQEKKSNLQLLEIEKSKKEIKELKEENSSIKNILERLSQIEQKIK